MRVVEFYREGGEKICDEEECEEETDRQTSEVEVIRR